MIAKTGFFIFALLICLYSSAQELPKPSEGDTVALKIDSTQKPHSVRKAVLLSAALPGLGQAYNRKYWKMPLVYGALGATIYFASQNHSQYRIYSDGFDALIRGEDRFNGLYTENDLITIQNDFRKDRDLMIILSVLAYSLNLLDAYVDAHLFYYDMSDNISLNLQPLKQESPLPFVSLGLQLKWTLDPVQNSNIKLTLAP